MIFTLLAILLAAIVFAYIGIAIIHKKVFTRYDYKISENNERKTDPLEEFFTEQYPSKKMLVKSGKNLLAAYSFGENRNGKILIISSGHQSSRSSSFPQMAYFVERGWQVILYDYTGYYESQGKDSIGYVQSVKDLNAIIIIYMITTGNLKLRYMDRVWVHMHLQRF